jgi:hypothetical protein
LLITAVGQENTKTSYSEQVKAFEDVDRVKEPIATGNKPHDENVADDGYGNEIGKIDALC